MPWFDGGIQTNPVINAILVDTGALPASQFAAKIILGGNVAAVATVEQRDSTNTTNLKTQTIAIPINGVVDLDFPGVVISANERIRLRLNAAVTGSIHASILTY